MAYASSTPDFSGLFDAYQQGADFRRRSYLQDLEEKGRALQGQALAGDQNALVELGKISPQAYMQTQQFTQEQKKARLGEFLSAAYSAKTPEAWKSVVDRFRAQGHQFDPGEDDFANRENLIRQGMSVADQMGLDFRTQESQRAQANADRSYALDKERVGLERQRVAEGGANKPPAGYRYKADGSMEFIPGGPADPNKPVPARSLRPTESQIKGQAIESGSNISAQHLLAGATPENPAPGVDQAATAWNSAMQSVPVVGRWLMTGEGQVSYDDLFNVAQNYTYALSGAQAPEQEVQRNLSLILPNVRDKPEAIKAKKERLVGYINTIKARAAGPSFPNMPGAAQPTQDQQGELQPGTVEDGYVFLGGDPADQNNWQEAR